MLVITPYINHLFLSTPSHIMELAREAGAVYKVGMSALINTELFEEYLEQFRENPIPLPKHIVDKSKMKK